MLPTPLPDYLYPNPFNIFPLLAPENSCGFIRVMIGGGWLVELGWPDSPLRAALQGAKLKIKCRI